MAICLPNLLLIDGADDLINCITSKIKKKTIFFSRKAYL